METGVSCASFQSLNRALSADKQVPVKGWWMRAALPATRLAESVATRAALRVVGRGGQDGMGTYPDLAGLESAALRRSGKAKGRKPRASRTTSANSTGFPLEPQAFAGRVQPRIDLTLRATNPHEKRTSRARSGRFNPLVVGGVAILTQSNISSSRRMEAWSRQAVYSSNFSVRVSHSRPVGTVSGV